MKSKALSFSHAGHPLTVEQRNGITMERLEEIARNMLHPDCSGCVFPSLFVIRLLRIG